MKLVLKKWIFQLLHPSANTTESLFKEYMTEKFFVRLLGRAFKVLKNVIYFIVLAFLLVVKYSRIVLIYANQRTCDVTMWTQHDVK